MKFCHLLSCLGVPGPLSLKQEQSFVESLRTGRDLIAHAGVTRLALESKLGDKGAGGWEVEGPISYRYQQSFLSMREELGVRQLSAEAL
jgi:hypothetical protein